MDNKYMEKAIKLSEFNKRNSYTEGGPFGAVIVDENGIIVGEGHNQVLLDQDPTAHAEVKAIRDAANKVGLNKLKNCKLYTSCYPCPMCLGAIMWAGIKNVEYANTEIDADNIGFGDHEYYEAVKNGGEPFVNLKHTPSIQAQRVFSEFKDESERVMY